MRTKRLLIPLLLLLLLAFAGVVLSAPLAAPVPTLERSVMAAGGGRGEHSGSGMVMFGTVGQPVAGRSPPGDDVLCTGFWCGCDGAVTYPVYLPLIVR
jgi:hypothetical protein